MARAPPGKGLKRSAIRQLLLFLVIVGLVVGIVWQRREHAARGTAVEQRANGIFVNTAMQKQLTCERSVPSPRPTPLPPCPLHRSNGTVARVASQPSFVCTNSCAVSRR